MSLPNSRFEFELLGQPKPLLVNAYVPLPLSVVNNQSDVSVFWPDNTFPSWFRLRFDPRINEDIEDTAFDFQRIKGIRNI